MEPLVGDGTHVTHRRAFRLEPDLAVAPSLAGLREDRSHHDTVAVPIVHRQRDGIRTRGAEGPYVALDLEPARVMAARRGGRRVFYGDASDPRLLDQVGTGRAAALVITLDRPNAAERIVTSVRTFYPGLAILARAHDVEGRDRLERLGASIVVPETLELSLRLGEEVLRRLGIAEDAVGDATQTLRSQR